MRHWARALRAGMFATALAVALIADAAAESEAIATRLATAAGSTGQGGGGGPFVKVRLTAGRLRPDPGQQVVYRIAMRNRGGAAARDVRLRVRLPPILQHLKGGRHRDGSRIVIFSVDRLAAGARRAFEMRTRVREAGAIVIRSRVRYRRERRGE